MASDFIDATGEGPSSEAWRRALASAAALLAAVLLVVLVILVEHSNRARDEALLRERHSYEVMLVTRGLGTSMARAEAALGRFVMSGDRNTGAIYYDEWKRARRLIQRLGQITGNEEQAALVRQLKTLYDQRGRELAPAATRSNFRQNLNAVSLYYEAGKSDTILHIDAIMKQIGAKERAILGLRSSAAAASAERSNYLVALLSALGVLLVVGSIALGWTTIQAMAHGRLFRRRAQAEAERAETLEYAVAERTRELQEANDRLREEAATRAATEAQLRQAQKMEAVGQLTGGIAHDFNNMLAVVVGALDLARRRLSDDEADGVGRLIDNAMEGANRAAALTRRLLTFARAEPLIPEGVEPGKLIGDMTDLLDRTLGERVRVETRVEADPWQIWCDPHQLENAILNLAVNARDAMEDEGRLLIQTGNVTLAAGEVGVVEAGEYVRIAVTDDGCGMEPEVLERVFEPFFTTKPVGKGTGLGLSQIFGFARQSGGDVDIVSAPGEGTTVALYLPRFAQASQRISPTAFEWPAALTAPLDASGAKILVVEDDVRVRAATTGSLEELGYVPLPCASGDEAIALLAEHGDIRLIITDVVMPGMTGPQLIAAVGAAYPHIGVLFVTGYAGEAGEAGQFANHDLLRKPFTVSALEAAVANALARARQPAERAA